MNIFFDLQDSIRPLITKKVGGVLGHLRGSLSNKSEQQKLQIARNHFINAVKYKSPRYGLESESSLWLLKIVYNVQTSQSWQWILVIISYVFMYLVLLAYRKPELIQSTIECIILVVFWLDAAMNIYHKKNEIVHQEIKQKTKFSLRFYLKIIFLSLLTIDQLAAILNPDRNQIRVFLIVRCFIPVVYDRTLAKNVEAMFSLYKDIFVFTFFYAIVIVLFTILSHRSIRNKKQIDYEFDEYTQNYNNFTRTLFLTYALSTFQQFPDNQLKQISHEPSISLFFIGFILLNLFFFVTIPTSLLFKTFKDARSKIVLGDELRQQGSLILSFACLCDESFQITRDKFISFLLLCFRRKPGYIDEITQIFMEVDENGNGKIQITQFMQICKIMNNHDSLYPPYFDDWQKWIGFRSYVNEKIRLKELVLSSKFKIIITAFVILSIINCIVFVFTKSQICHIVDNLITLAYLIEFISKFIGIGPQNLFKDSWNKLDFFIFLIILAIQLIPEESNSPHLDILFKLCRLYRIALLPQHLMEKEKFISLEHISIKISRLVTQTLITIPIVMEFFPMYLITFYFFGIFGIYIYANQKPLLSPEESQYSKYYEIANFNSLLSSQLYMIQILIEAGWSLVCFDYQYRYGVPEWVTILFFISTHFSIALIVSSLIKGVTWQVYQKIENELNAKVTKLMSKMKEEKRMKQKLETFEEIRKKIDLCQDIVLDNLVSRQIFEGKVDKEILKKMEQAEDDQKNDYLSKRDSDKRRANLLPLLVKDLALGVDQLHMSFRPQRDDQITKNIKQSLSQSNIRFREISDLRNSDFDQEIQRIITKAVVDKTNSYTETIAYPQILINFLQSKLKTIQKFRQEQQSKKEKEMFENIRTSNESADFSILRSQFDISSDQISKNQQGTLFLVHSIKSLLQMKNSQKQQKKRIVEDLVKEQIINQQEAKTLIELKRRQKSLWIDPTWVLRQTFLANTSQKHVQKFEIQHFSKIYGPSFKQINKITIKPLLRQESKITYCLRNALRYRQMNELQFFTIIQRIEDLITRKLMKKGSIFKFLFQIDSLNQTWFFIEVNQSQELKIHFLKNGLWLWYRRMNPETLYLAKDFFYWDQIQDIDSKQQPQLKEGNKLFLAERFIKYLYQSFQSLALSLPQQDNFFVSNPSSYQYNLYTIYTNVQQTQRVLNRRFSVSKIMAVALSNEGLRIHNNEVSCLKYQLTDIKLRQKREEESIRFSFGGLQEQTKQLFSRFAKLQTMDEEEIEEDEGLPHAYILNFFQEIQDILKSYQVNFVYHLQRILNKLGPNQSLKLSKIGTNSNNERINFFSKVLKKKETLGFGQSLAQSQIFMDND